MDKKEIEKIIDKYSDTVYRLAFTRTGNSCDADEVYQEVFLRLIKNNHQFNDEEHCKAWLIKVTVNCAKKLTCSSWRKRTQPINESLSFETQRDIDIWWEISQLPPKYREVIHLYYFEDMSTEEISKVLGIKNTTVRSQLKRAREKLKIIIEEANDYV